MTLAADTSVAVAAILADHEAHAEAEEALGSCTATIAHVATETYSVLTRLPHPHRLDAVGAAEVIALRLPARRAALGADEQSMIPERLAAAGISGGATYDGLVALTALAHDLELISRDRRAARTYRALGVGFHLLGT